MRLPFFGKKEKKEYFLALLLRDEKVTAVIFEEFLGKMRVIGQHETYFTDSVDSASSEEWLDVLDRAVSSAERAITNTTETRKTIFGVKENWVEDAKLKKEYLGQLKKASDALGLVPIGFLVIHEAIAHLMQIEEGAPVSAVLVEIGKKTIAVSLLRAGRIVETKRTKILGESVAKIADRLLHHFTSYEVLPSRIVIVGDTENTESLSQEFISHTWSKSLPFLHVPQVKIQPKDFEAKAVLVGAASQMGFEMLEDAGKNAAEEKTAEKEFQQEEPKNQVITTEDFGFVKEKDIVIHTISSPAHDEKEDKEEIVEKKEETEESLQTSTFLDTIQNLILPVLSPIFNFRPTTLMQLSKSSTMKTKLFTIGGTLLGFIILLLLSYIFFLNATVTLTVASKVIEKNQNILFSTTATTDFDNKIIAAQISSATIDGTIVQIATGKKEIGTNAKGIVTIYSRYSSEKTFPQGTILNGPNNLTFAFDKAITIASGSADASSDPIKINVSVTAKSIGKESNFPSNTRFTIDDVDASLAIAKNDAPFSGGTKKEVTVVSKTDTEKAMNDLAKNLTSKAKSDLKKKIAKENELLGALISSNFVKKNFDKDIGEEASKTLLTATVSYDGLSYKKDDLKHLAKNLLKNTDTNNAFSQEDVTYEIKDVKQKKDQISAVLFAKALLMPNIDNQKLATDVSGKSFTDSQAILSKLPQVSDVRIALHPSFFFLPSSMPRMAKNIHFIITKE